MVAPVPVHGPEVHRTDDATDLPAEEALHPRRTEVRVHRRPSKTRGPVVRASVGRSRLRAMLGSLPGRDRQIARRRRAEVRLDVACGGPHRRPERPTSGTVSGPARRRERRVASTRRAVHVRRPCVTPRQARGPARPTAATAVRPPQARRRGGRRAGGAEAATGSHSTSAVRTASGCPGRCGPHPRPTLTSRRGRRERGVVVGVLRDVRDVLDVTHRRRRGRPRTPPARGTASAARARS